MVHLDGVSAVAKIQMLQKSYYIVTLRPQRLASSLVTHGISSRQSFEAVLCTRLWECILMKH